LGLAALSSFGTASFGHVLQESKEMIARNTQTKNQQFNRLDDTEKYRHTPFYYEAHFSPQNN